MNHLINNTTRVCCDIGGTRIKGARIRDGKIRCFRQVLSHGKESREAILDALFQLIESLMTKAVNAIAVSTAGDIDSEHGVCMYAANLKGWTGLALKEVLENRYHLPAFIENDAFCHLNAEMRLLPSRENVTMLTFGTGIGGASLIRGQRDRTRQTQWGYRVIVPDGKYLEGAPERGVAEAYLSIHSINEILSQHPELTEKKLFDGYREGQPQMVALLYDYEAHLNALLTLINHEIHPDVIILGGGMMVHEAAFKKMIRPENSNIRFAAYGNKAGVIGAYYLPMLDNVHEVQSR